MGQAKVGINKRTWLGVRKGLRTGEMKAVRDREGERERGRDKDDT